MKESEYSLDIKIDISIEYIHSAQKNNKYIASGFTLHIFIRMNHSFALSLWRHRSRVPEHKMQNATKQQLQQARGDNGPTYALMLLALSTLPDLLRLEQLSTTWVATELGWEWEWQGTSHQEYCVLFRG